MFNWGGSHFSSKSSLWGETDRGVIYLGLILCSIQDVDQKKHQTSIIEMDSIHGEIWINSGYVYILYTIYLFRYRSDTMLCTHHYITHCIWHLGLILTQERQGSSEVFRSGELGIFIHCMSWVTHKRMVFFRFPTFPVYNNCFFWVSVVIFAC